METPDFIVVFRKDGELMDPKEVLVDFLHDDGTHEYIVRTKGEETAADGGGIEKQ